MAETVDSRSWWHLTPGAEVAEAASFQGDVEADVVIIGAGFTGLWTAYYLKQADPSLSICLLEARFAGFGASGRNGGWCTGSLAADDGRYEKKRRGGALAMHRAVQESVDEVGRVAAAHQFDCHYAKGGTLFPAVTRVQLKRLQAQVAEARETGLAEDDVRLLDVAEASAHLNIPGLLGGLFTPHCAAIHPYRLVLGLADVLRQAGVVIYENSPVTAIEGRRAVTGQGTARGRMLVRATEAYTGSIRGQERRIAPIYNYMVVTEPIERSLWKEIGLEARQTFEDARAMIYYGQRTADDRIAIGGLAAPYRYGSKIDARFERTHPAHERLERLLAELFPMLGRPTLAHRWGGVLGVPRDFFPSVGYDREAGFAWAGGYVGEGVAAANLAGRTLADLLLERDTPLCQLPWVNHRSPRWEPEPFRWLGAKAISGLLSFQDWLDRTR